MPVDLLCKSGLTAVNSQPVILLHRRGWLGLAQAESLDREHGVSMANKELVDHWLVVMSFNDDRRVLPFNPSLATAEYHWFCTFDIHHQKPRISIAEVCVKGRGSNRKGTTRSGIVAIVDMPETRVRSRWKHKINHADRVRESERLNRHVVEAR